MSSFTITFHTPFHISTGGAERGLDRLVDPDNPLPASSLKGRMRAAAFETLQLDAEFVNEVFGHRYAPSPWWWSDASFDAAPHIRNITQVRIDDTSGTSDEGLLMFGQHVWACTATFSVEQRHFLDEATVRVHDLVLRASARAVVSLGGQRRRGEGWVTIDSGPWKRTDTVQLLKLKARA